MDNKYRPCTSLRVVVQAWQAVCPRSEVCCLWAPEVPAMLEIMNGINVLRLLALAAIRFVFEALQLGECHPCSSEGRARKAKHVADYACCQLLGEGRITSLPRAQVVLGTPAV